MENNIAATLAVFSRDGYLLLIKRKFEPFKGKWAFPGGFMDPGENLYQTAVRELKEETGIEVSTENIELLDIRSDPDRDPRGHIIDVGFFTVIEKTQDIENSNETEPEWVSINRARDMEMAFDHDKLLERVLTKINQQ